MGKRIRLAFLCYIVGASLLYADGSDEESVVGDGHKQHLVASDSPTVHHGYGAVSQYPLLHRPPVHYRCRDQLLVGGAIAVATTGLTIGWTVFFVWFQGMYA